RPLHSRSGRKQYPKSVKPPEMTIENIKNMLKTAVTIPYIIVAAPFYLVLYLYEKLLNRLWHDPYDCEDDDLT
ncbi:MAG: hypothetical protein K2L00_00780, partial [Muribaculaceae bacterium]|nr:hypothetical protein [Muribaculaceae bacterium]